MMVVLFQLFVSYLKIGFFGFGGGYAMLSLIHSEIVERNEWLTNAEFADIVADDTRSYRHQLRHIHRL